MGSKTTLALTLNRILRNLFPVWQMNVQVCLGLNCRWCQLVNQIGYLLGMPWLVYICDGLDADTVRLLGSTLVNGTTGPVTACEIQVFA